MIERLIQQVALFNPDAVNIPKGQASGAQVQAALTFFFSLIGVVALLIITFAGLQYILSQGDPQKTAKAKDTILYAVIGLVIALCAIAIVNLVINRVG